ncbi:terminase [Salinicola sp. DM10]|uniref:terminase n=1 Tax=Salinicola sp. DM10 TaxID=2815721 RepID=UPI001A8DB609|nr:terminase [Salinicola sp. DM10]MCE3025737.1 terminase [Salinicola sp. DM10]
MSDRTREVKRADRFLRLYREGRLTERADLIYALSLKWFRLNALYRIKDKNGKVRRFRPNLAQRERFVNAHYWDLILKARQLGFTTFEMIDALDDCLFTANYSAGCIAHKLDDAKDIFHNKIRFAFENIDDQWLAIFKLIGLKLPRPVNDKGESMRFDNGSSIKVSTSYRGGTLQRLHVSEFGKICRKYPDKAKEIVTGAFEAVGVGNKITIESTAEGREGYFFDYAQGAQQLQQMGRAPTELDFQFHFFPWWQDPAYRINPDGVVVPQWIREYFEQLDLKYGIKTDAGQQAWYAKKAETLQDDMKREYPSRPEEAFEQSAEGAYYLQQMLFLRKNGRITTKVQHNPALPVFTAWDLGMNDSMAIWFAQVVGREIHLIDYLEDSGEGIEYYADLLNKKPYRYGGHFGPHDLAVKEIGTGKSRVDVAKGYGIQFTVIPRITTMAEGRQAVRAFLPQCWIAEDQCSQGVDCLDNYRREWDDKLGVYKDRPRHDWASHGAKAFETLARSDIFERAGFGGGFNAPSSNQQSARQRWGAHT